jgi:hypothetical protein
LRKAFEIGALVSPRDFSAGLRSRMPISSSNFRSYIFRLWRASVIVPFGSMPSGHPASSACIGRRSPLA